MSAVQMGEQHDATAAEPDPDGCVPAACGSVSILLIDDRALTRDGLKEILLAVDGFVVVGEADTAQQAAEALIGVEPDVILVHVHSAAQGVTDCVRQIRDSFPHSRVIVLSMDDCAEVLYSLLALGVSGYLTNATRQGLVAAIRCSLERDNQILVSVSRDALAPPVAPSRAEPTLTARELEILALASQALSNTQIARQVFLTEATVKRHLRNIFVKLGAVSRIDAVNKAVAAALLPPPQPERTSV